jgi:hypothetical protein
MSIGMRMVGAGSDLRSCTRKACGKREGEGGWWNTSCTKIVRDRLHLPAQLSMPAQPSTRLGNWYVHLARFGRQQIVLATSERSLLTVLLPAHRLRETIEVNFHGAVRELLAALQLPAHVVSRELAAMQPISFAVASNRRVIGSMNEYVWQLGIHLSHTSDPLELSLQLSKTPMSAVGSKSNYGFPDEAARDLLMNWEH